MKKLLTTTLALCIATTAVACGNSNTPQTTTVTEKTIQETTAPKSDLSELDAIGDVEVEKELFDVVITIPADYIGESTQEELENKAAEIGYKVVLNSDGSATYTMTKSQHKRMMQELTDNINSSLDELVGSEDYPNITAIETNDDFTEFTITTKSEKLELAESFSVIGFYMYGGMYNIFNGTSFDNIHVDFVNADTGEIISSSDSNDMGTEER